MQVWGIPAAEGFQRSHQNARSPSTQEGPPRGEPSKRLGGGEQDAPQRGERHHRGRDKAWAIAVQANADGKEHQRECRVEQAGHQTEVGCTQGEFAHEIRSNDGVGGSEEVSDEVGDCEQTEDVDTFRHAVLPTDPRDDSSLCGSVRVREAYVSTRAPSAASVRKHFPSRCVRRAYPDGTASRNASDCDRSTRATAAPPKPAPVI